MLHLSYKFVLEPHSLTTNGSCRALGYILHKENAILMEVVTNYDSLSALKALKIYGIYGAKE